MRLLGGIINSTHMTLGKLWEKSDGPYRVNGRDVSKQIIDKDRAMLTQE